MEGNTGCNSEVTRDLLLIPGAVVWRLLQVHQVSSGWSLEASFQWPKFLSLSFFHKSVGREHAKLTEKVMGG